MRPFTAPWGESYIRGTSLQAVTTVGCAAGFYLFGYDQGIANALTQNANFFIKFPQLANNSNVLGAVLGSFVLGAFFGCLSVSAIGNKWGRRPILNIASFTTLITAALQAGAVNLGMFVVFRFLNGFAVGVLTCVVPCLMAELSKPRIRGLMMALELVFAASGLMTAFWIAYGFAENQGATGWRIPLALQAAFVLITCLSLQFTPESPRWLMEAGRVEEGRAVLTRLHGAEYADQATLEIQEAIALEHATVIKGWSICFAKNDQMFRYRTFLAVGVNFLQQATGINTATYYAGVIFTQAIGLAPPKASLALGGLGIAGLAATAFGCFVLIEKAGRVRTMMGGSFFQMVGMIMLAAGVANVDKKAGGYVAATGLYLYLCAFSATYLPCGFLYGAEISPLAIRTQAACLGTAVQYILNFAIVEVTPTAIGAIGWKYYLVYVVTNAVTIPIVYFFFPEIAGLSLEGIDELFAGGKVRMRRSVHDDVGHQALDSVRAKVLGGVGAGREKESISDKVTSDHFERV